MHALSTRAHTRDGVHARDIHHFARALSYPRCESRVSARMHVFETIEHT